MANRRFIDTDGKLATIAFGAEITGDGSTALTQGDKYLVTAIDSGTSGLPTGAKVKYIIEAGAATVPATGDKVKPLVVTDACDVQGASVEFTKDELETTTICDTTKTYRAGRADASGSIQAVTTGSTFYKDIANRFVNLSVQTADASAVTVTELTSGKLYLQLVINKDVSDGESEMFYFLPVELTSFNAGLQQAATQTFESAFRITSDETSEVALYEFQSPAV